MQKSATSKKMSIAQMQDLLFTQLNSSDKNDLPKDALQIGAKLAIEKTSAFSGRKPVTSFENGWLIIICKDTPFIVDSILGRLQHARITPKVVSHPQLQTNGYDVSLMALFIEDKDHGAITKEFLDDIGSLLADVNKVVSDWPKMTKRVEMARQNLVNDNADTETIAFIDWLLDNHFIFMGIRSYDWSEKKDGGQLVKSTKEKSIGLLANDDMHVLRQGSQLVSMTPEIREFLKSDQRLIITKAGVRSRVHRTSHYDYIGIKRYDEKGNLSGELRIIGLFTSSVYYEPIRSIPILRDKVAKVVKSANLPPNSHDEKALLTALEHYPRDDMFQIDQKLLKEFGLGIAQLEERPRTRIFMRADKFNRFVACLIYVPKDRYNSEVRTKMGAYLAEQFDGRVSMFQPAFSESSLARVHIIIGRDGAEAAKINKAKIEKDIADIALSWQDHFNAIEPNLPDMGFSEAYKETHDAQKGAQTARQLQNLSDEAPLSASFKSADEDQISLNLLHLGEALPLSQRVPVLENFGFSVLEETTFQALNGQAHIHEMRLTLSNKLSFDAEKDATRLEEAFLAVWNGAIGNDGYNKMVLGAGLTGEQAGMLRAYSNYFQQMKIGFTQDYIWGTLSSWPKMAGLFWKLFEAKFDPSIKGSLKTRIKNCEQIASQIEGQLEAVSSLDEDTILRRFLNVIQATLRTNYYQGPIEAGPTQLAFKLSPKDIIGLPEPRPYREMWVYGNQVEGVHLRYGPVARGGLRWSDRAQDFRTEVLGLVKAQQVKNAVIVPVGAKGGFFAKQLPDPSIDRNAWFEAGRDAYKTFIRSMLSITDNIEGETITTPAGIIAHDDKDPYFVVAADKGTATFSDTANGIAADMNFWLDDAFASGGSAGYDHKKMGITARGGWEAVKRHFREMDRDIQTTPFTAIGVGDMSGDVFGNGMLLSKQTKLIAAFDHRDIFIDPDPDPKTSFLERQRIFDLGRSSWQDYNRKKLSKGGMIISRQEKQITLTPEAQKALGLAEKQFTVHELLKNILLSKVDLLWFGGIGTYVKAENESHEEVGDRANNPIRVDAHEVGAKVIGEGANLGITQPARIAFGAVGGRCNSDAIDNSAGVNSSDVEVNIKIAMSDALHSGKLPRDKRNAMLERMTDEVAALCLQNNYLQTLAITIEENEGLEALPRHQRMMQALEETGELDREVEDLPNDKVLVQRQERGQPLTRSEIGVLLAYAKIILFEQIVASKLPDDPYLSSTLENYFPTEMQKELSNEIASHRLRREIISTALANDIINNCGPAFVIETCANLGCTPADVVNAFLVVKQSNGLGELLADIHNLDNKVPWQMQCEFYQQVRNLIQQQTFDMLRRHSKPNGLADDIAQQTQASNAVITVMPPMLPDYLKEIDTNNRQRFALEHAVSKKLADTIADLRLRADVPDICAIAEQAKSERNIAAQVYFDITEGFKIGKVLIAASNIHATDGYQSMALNRSMQSIRSARTAIASAACKRFKGKPSAGINWLEANQEKTQRVASLIEGLVEDGAIAQMDVTRLSVIASSLQDLALGK